ncbi:Na+/H+ antiporter NhaC [Tepidibacter aestuarii]|uniref:Na+/H+ antiporter NhaC n=1 Tax=Tepidibacter aestuarii TaxID=2925782 RepID=UPI0020BE12EE|nr:Na+/H+ antiporter NhaC [Tepidibacter aestuarii]CAH2214528.1 malate-H+/Na+-lactate antiporter [Tepidibacter aestuarii]
MEKKIKLPSMFQVSVVLSIFLALAFSFTTVFELPIQLALFISWFVIIGLGIKLGHSYKDLEASIAKGIYNGMDAILILIAVGALVGTWIAGGIVPSLIYYGLKVISPKIFLLATLFVCALTSIATGTSWGTAGTAGIAMMGIGQGLGIPLPLVAGAVLSGSYFGDKISPLSDSTVLTASMSGIDVMDHIKGMAPASIPGFLITCVLFTITGLKYAGQNVDLGRIEMFMNALNSNFNISVWCFLPMIMIIGLLAKRKPSLPVIAFGAFLGAIWAVIFQGMDSVSALSTLYNPFDISTGVEFVDNILGRGGISSMLGSIVIIIFGLGVGGLLDKIGLIEVIARKFENWITNTGRLATATVGTAILGNVFGSAMYVPLILTPKIMAKNYDELKVHRRVLSRNTEFGGTLTAGMVPWSDNGIFMAGILGVPTLQYLPYMWLAFTCLAITIIYGYMGKFQWIGEKVEFTNYDKGEESA